MKKLFFILSVMLFLFSCKNEEKEDLVNEVPKDGSIETSVNVDHLNDSMDILITKHKVYKNATTSQIIIKNDTIPSLGTTVVKDENENSKTIKRDYDIFITVK